jgi:hypothetical protein
LYIIKKNDSSTRGFIASDGFLETATIRSVRPWWFGLLCKCRDVHLYCFNLENRPYHLDVGADCDC